MGIRTINAPGVEITEIDKSAYSPAMVGTACYVLGYTDKGQPYEPMEFTSKTAWMNAYGEPKNEAERYSYAAVSEVLDNNGRLYFARMSYDNASTGKMPCASYGLSVIDGKNDATISAFSEELCANDPTFNPLSSVNFLKINEPGVEYAELSDADGYYSKELSVPDNTLKIFDRSCNTYKKIIEDSRVGEDAEFLGILPVVTTAADAMKVLNYISSSNGTISSVFTKKITGKEGDVTWKSTYLSSASYDLNTIENWISSGKLSVENFNGKWKQTTMSATEYTWAQVSAFIEAGTLSTLMSSDTKWYWHQTISGSSYSDNGFDLNPLDTNKKLTEEFAGESFNISVDGHDLLIHFNAVRENYSDTDRWHWFLTIDSETKTYSNDHFTYNPFSDDGKLAETFVSLSFGIELSSSTKELSSSTKSFTGCGVYERNIYSHELLSSDLAIGLDSLYDDALTNFSLINLNVTDNVQSFDRTATKQIGIVVYKMYLDPSYDNKVNFTAIESYVGQLDPNAKDPTTGKSMFIQDIVNTNSDNIYAFVGKVASLSSVQCTYSTASGAPSLGFFSSETDSLISQNGLYKSMNNCFVRNADVNERDIDIVIDAGLANINSYLAASYLSGDAHKYDLNDTDAMNKWSKAMTSNSTAIKNWKKIEQNFDTFCKKTRKDCMFIADGPRPLVLQGNKKIVRVTKPENSIDKNIIPYIKWTTGLNTNFGAGYIDWFEVADSFSGDLFWCPPSIKAAGVYINTDVNFNYWDAPAGLNRGKIAATDVAFSPTIKQAGSFYEKNWNYAINYPQDGIILEGQKTFQVAPTALDRVNVRRLMLRLERQSRRIARYFVYEGNTAYTRQRLVDMLTPDFKDAKIGGGLYDYKIVCDESNNTSTTIDRNELHVAIGVKPVRTAEFIMIDFIVAPTGVSWDEVM